MSGRKEKMKRSKQTKRGLNTDKGPVNLIFDKISQIFSPLFGL
jgi:hypothetical protein